MISFKDEVKELENIKEKLAEYENSAFEYKIVMLADQLITISNSIKDKYKSKYPGRLEKVNKNIYMDKFEQNNDVEDHSRLDGVRNIFDGKDEIDDMDDMDTENMDALDAEMDTMELDKNKINENLWTDTIDELIEEKFDTGVENEDSHIYNTQPLEFMQYEDENFFEEIAEKINELTFLYKPMEKKNYLEGDYLERFSSQRDSDLQKSNAMRIHNTFWKANSVEHGNIFGSVPIDLIDENAATKLLYSGWRIAEVYIYDVKSEMDLWELNDRCLKQFENFLIVKEKKDGYTLIFEYKI